MKWSFKIAFSWSNNFSSMANNAEISVWEKDA